MHLQLLITNREKAQAAGSRQAVQLFEEQPLFRFTSFHGNISTVAAESLLTPRAIYATGFLSINNLFEV